jgi:hypothetical protein
MQVLSLVHDKIWLYEQDEELSMCLIYLAYFHLKLKKYLFYRVFLFNLNCW